jgi:hypothetical protein
MLSVPLEVACDFIRVGAGMAMQRSVEVEGEHVSDGGHRSRTPKPLNPTSRCGGEERLDMGRRHGADGAGRGRELPVERCKLQKDPSPSEARSHFTCSFEDCFGFAGDGQAP